MTMSFQEACDTVCAPGTRFEIEEIDVFGVPTKVFTGTPPNMRHLFAAAAARTDDFIVFEDERWPMPRVMDLIGQIGPLWGEADEAKRIEGWKAVDKYIGRPSWRLTPSALSDEKRKANSERE